ncbi:indole-3-glycerol phosphate synthase TrpC [Bacillaceae bacterium Marseille-Q3522]|nr:indole-3-glycerol phosphate synthase TrpC [Bacillaceae bacterium Marseille-Q3522]
MTILDKIIAVKQKEVEQLKQQPQMQMDVKKNKQVSFISAIKKSRQLAIIAEFKRASPSKGVINLSLSPQEQALSYVENGADAVSVLTDQTFFKGSHQDLAAVRKAISRPILCKDFIIDPIQIDLAKAVGANIILLIVAALEQEKLTALYNYATEKQLDVLIEVHNEAELERALLLEAPLIGVNNRNLKTFQVDLATTEKLAPQVKQAGAMLISESGIHSIADVERAVRAGANGILVGEAFMKAENAGLCLRQMKGVSRT